MEPTAFRVRPAGSDDAPALADLAGQLGYPAGALEMRARLSRLEGAADRNAVWVAESAEGAVIGWIHVQGRDVLESESFAEIAGLVVDAGSRGARVGATLLDRALDWARRCGYSEARVRSNVAREQAHRFYERQGFVLLKSQRVYARRLDPTDR